MAKQSSKGGGAKKHGRDKDKCAAYKSMHTREKNKVKRVLRSSGKKAAEKYADQHNVLSYLKSLPSWKKQQ